MNTLKTIQTLSKIGKIISRIIFILCIVGFVGCIIGMISLAVIPSDLKIGDVTIHAFIEEKAKISIGACYAAMAAGMVLCVGEAVQCKFAELYFTHELAAGTPFTFDGSKELTKLGILTICISLGTSVVAAIVFAIIKAASSGTGDLSLHNYSSAGIGVMFIIAGLLCKYGAEIRAAQNSETEIEK